ncbi:ATP-binding protein [uncultured Nitrospira sp.]|uniref:sensor histidine kinase n=1 Tax=uncultured Nitrospira sp. TaxID=157176 RepID=UPI003140868E
MRNLVRTASFRLTILTGGLFLVFLIMTFAIYYWIAVSYVYERIDAEMDWKIQTLTQEYQSKSFDPSDPDLVEPGSYVLLQDATGRFIVKILPIKSDDQRWLSQLLPEPIPMNNASKTFRAKAVALPDGSRMVVASDLNDIRVINELFGEVFVWILVTIVILSSGCGVLVSTIILRRVGEINLLARDIMNGHLDRRIPLRGTNDEFDRLSINLNLMLDRIEKLMDQVRQVSIDLAHDLRTPLARMRQRLEVARRQATCMEDYEKAIDKALIQNEEILETFSALLRIAYVGSGVGRQNFEDISLTDMLETIGETYEPIAEERKQGLVSTIESGLMIHADRKLLTQMIVNLLENAIRHTPAETQISMTASRTTGGVMMVIADTGPGVSEVERDKIFQPFYRLETSRTTPGSGLGLSLVSAIAHLHDITIHLSDNRPGLCVTLFFPTTSTRKL